MTGEWKQPTSINKRIGRSITNALLSFQDKCLTIYLTFVGTLANRCRMNQYQVWNKWSLSDLSIFTFRQLYWHQVARTMLFVAPCGRFLGALNYKWHPWCTIFNAVHRKNNRSVCLVCDANLLVIKLWCQLSILSILTTKLEANE